MNNKTIIGILVAVILIGIIGVSVINMNNKEVPVTETNTVQNTPTDNSVSTTVTSTSTTITTETNVATTSTPKPVVKASVKPVQKAPVSSNSIVISNYSFSPQTLTIKKGTTVTWTNKDLARHTVTVDDNSFESSFFGQGEIYSHTFNDVGTITYHCSPHPYMKATIIVTN